MGSVDVGREDALLEVVEHDDADGAAQPPKRPLVQFGPDLCTRPTDQQADGLARVAQGQDEEPCPPVLRPKRAPLIRFRLPAALPADSDGASLFLTVCDGF